MAESALPEELLSAGSDSTMPEESLSTGQGTIFDLTCAPCCEEGYYKEAERYCLDCRDHLCLDCVRDHENVRSLKRHKLLDIIKDVKNMRTSQEADCKAKSGIKVKSSSNTHICMITGMVIVSVDKVVAADGNNGTIKLIDIANNTIVSEYKPERNPWGITSCKDTVAATLPWFKKIVFLKHAEGLVYDRQINVDGNCRGIDWYNDNLYVVFDKQKKLEVMTPTGVVLQIFNTIHGQQQLFQNPQYVTVNAANQRIYVSEHSMGRVVELDLAGNQTGSYDDEELGRPRQLAVDGDGAMFLCDLSKNTVHLLSPTGEKMKILLTEQDGLLNPRTVCYCKNMGSLYVGTYRCDTIKVFTILKQAC